MQHLEKKHIHLRETLREKNLCCSKIPPPICNFSNGGDDLSLSFICQYQVMKIETDRYHLPKIPENRRRCQLCSSDKVENEIHFLFKFNLYKNLRQHFFQHVEAKYSIFVDLNKSKKLYFFLTISIHMFVKILATMSVKHFNLQNFIP